MNISELNIACFKDENIALKSELSALKTQLADTNKKLINQLDRIATLIACRGEKNLNSALMKLNTVITQLRNNK